MNPTGLIGVAVMMGLVWLMSEDRRRFPWRLAGAGVALQFVIALLLLKTPGVADAFDLIARFFSGLIGKANEGIAFVFGPVLGDSQAFGKLVDGPGFIFAFHALPVIIFFAALMGVLYHMGVMQRLIAALAWLLRKSLGVTGTEALVIASNVFVGQTEAPLCVKPYMERFTRSQMATLMVGGFATIAGSVLVVISIIVIGAGEGEALAASRADFIKHLLTASVMSAPGAFVMAKILVPERDTPIDEGLHAVATEPAANLFDAAAHGTTDGLRLAVNVGAMLIAFFGLLALINWPLEALSAQPAIAAFLERNGMPPLSLEVILGWLFTPLAWAIGVESGDAAQVGSLMGQKLILTEIVAYTNLGSVLNEGAISERSSRIAAYALCGFANFASIGIQIGGLTAIAPGQRRTIVTLALKAMLAGALASWCTAAIASTMI